MWSVSGSLFQSERSIGQRTKHITPLHADVLMALSTAVPLHDDIVITSLFHTVETNDMVFHTAKTNDIVVHTAVKTESQFHITSPQLVGSSVFTPTVHSL